MNSEQDIINHFVKFLSFYLPARKIQDYQNSLDCALAVYIEGEKRGIPCYNSEKKIIEAVQEQGELWDFCVKKAYEQLAHPEDLNPAMKELIILTATHNGIKWLVEGFLDGY